MTDKEQKEIFAYNINRLLAYYHKTQKEVADAIEVSPQTFNTWVQAIALPRMGKVQRLADYFRVPKSALIDPISEPTDLQLTLSPDQEELLSYYDQLNSEGKAEALKQVSNLAKIKDYREDTPSSKEKMA